MKIIWFDINNLDNLSNKDEGVIASIVDIAKSPSAAHWKINEIIGSVKTDQLTVALNSEG